jgi:hypothetical protein
VQVATHVTMPKLITIVCRQNNDLVQRVHIPDTITPELLEDTISRFAKVVKSTLTLVTREGGVLVVDPESLTDGCWYIADGEFLH